MKYSITLTDKQYSTLMVALTFAEVTLGEGDYADKVRELVKDITASFEVVIEEAVAL
jgi:hypothetical protein